MQRGPARLPTICAAAAIAVVLGACGSDGPAANLRPTTTIAGGVAPTPTAAPDATDPPAATQAPEVTQAPVVTEAPVVTAAPSEPGPNPVAPESSDFMQALLTIGGIILAIAVIGALIARSRKSKPDHPATGTAPASPQSSLLSTSQWITDQLSLELMAAPPAAALQRWAVERSRLDNVAIGAQQQYLEANDANWQPLAQTMSALAAAIDTNLQLRAQEPPNAQLINESTDVVNRQRAAVQQLNAALWPTIGP